MSFKSNLWALFALLFFACTSQACAEDVTNAEVLDGVNEWRAAYATANGMDANEILVYERNISVNPPTTLMVCGKTHTFKAGDLVWNVCRRHLEEQAARPQPALIDQSQGNSATERAAPQPENSLTNTTIADKSQYEVYTGDNKSLTYVILGVIAFVALAVWLVFPGKRKRARREVHRKREYPSESPYHDQDLKSPASRPPPDP